MELAERATLQNQATRTSLGRRRPAAASAGLTHPVLLLQRLAGNRAVASVLAAQRACGCGCGGSGACADQVQRDDVDPAGLAGTEGGAESLAGGEASGELAAFPGLGDLPIPKLPSPGDVPGLIFGSPCTPFTSRAQAEAAWTFVTGSFIPFATGMFGPETAALWVSFLDRTSTAIPRPRQTLGGKASITAGFAAHHKTIEAEEGLLDKVIDKVNDGTIAVTPGTPKRVPLAVAIGAGTVTGMLNKGGSQEMNFDQVATTIPGNIAGGVGSGGPPGNTAADPDTRNASGDVDINVTPGPTGTVTVTSAIHFQVHDTVDFCPGALGGALARNETIPMSRLEATEARLGPVFAADVPFDVDYAGPGRSRSAPFTPVPPVPPPPPPPPVVLSNKVLFDFDSSKVKPEGQQAITDLLPKIRSAPTTDVIGHTDSTGSDKYNQGLSERRAQAVVDEILRQDPSLAGRLRPSGRGETEPIDTNDTPEGRSHNRRVELNFGN